MMRIGRKARIWLTAVAGTMLLLLFGYFGLKHFAEKIATSDELWASTKFFGFSLIQYAQNHDGEFPVSLRDDKFLSQFQNQDKEYILGYIRFIQPVYTPPTSTGTNVVKLLTAKSKWEKLEFFSDGGIKSTRP